MKAATLAGAFALALALAGAAALAYFVLPDPLASLMTEQFGSAPADFVRSLMSA
jgi:hypothetical protein